MIEPGFDERLDRARQFVAFLRRRGPQHPPGDPLADQLVAATRDSQHRLATVAALLPSLAPNRGWQLREGPEHLDDDGAETVARVLAALAFCRPCSHLRRPASPQVVHVQLGAHRIACDRCAHTVVNPPPGEDDRCDWCGARGVTRFSETTLAVGPFYVHGNACGTCNEALQAGVRADPDTPPDSRDDRPA